MSTCSKKDASLRQHGFSQPLEETGICDGTKGIAGIQVARYKDGTPPKTSHDADVHFTFVVEGSNTRIADGLESRGLEAGDAFEIPPGVATQFTNRSSGLGLLEATLRGDSHTNVHK